MDSTQPDAYDYAELHDGHAFRYLVLQPGRRGDTLACNLVGAHLHDTTTEYEAISYVWGSKVPDHEILCDGTALKITANLFEVMQNFRHFDKPRKLWADSICINQNDPKEREQQVAIMGEIYSRAKKVLVHIGGDDEGEAELARTLIEDVGNLVEAKIETLGTPIPWDSYPVYNANGPLLSDAMVGWVIQEAALAQDVKLFWNHTELNWHKLLRMAFWLTYKVPFMITAMYRRFCLRAHMDNYYTRHESIARAFLPKPKEPRFTLIECLNRSRDLEVTDGRDQLYAMIHLPSLDPESRYVPHIDYTSSVEEVYRNFAVEHVHGTKTPDILDYVTHTARYLRERWSWVPQWHKISEANSPMQTNRYLEIARLQPRGGHVAGPIVVEKNILRVRGLKFDTIVYSSETIPESVPTIMATDMIISMLQRMWNSIGPANPCPYKPGWRFEVFLKVVVMNMTQDDATLWFKSAATVYLNLAKTSKHPEAIKTPPWVLRITPTEPDMFCLSVNGVLYKRRVILTKRGYIGLAPLETREGDICAIVFGCRMPCVLRKADVDGMYRYVGLMYMPGKNMTDILGADGDLLGMGVSVLGTEESKDWTEWDDVKEEDIELC